MNFAKSKILLDLRLLNQELFYLNQAVPVSVQSEMYKELLKSIKDKIQRIAETVKEIETEESEEEDEER
jgi:hypothetical protein